MKRSDILTAEERSTVLKETSEELNRESVDLRSESLRLRAKSRKLVEEIKKNIPRKKAAGLRAPLREGIAAGTLAGKQIVQAAAKVA